MLFTCLFLLPHVNYALNVILVQVVDKSYFEMAPPKLYSTLHAEIRHLLLVSHQIWALETIVNNPKSIANFGNLNEIYLVADFW